MKTRNLLPLAVIGLLLFFAGSCKKDNPVAGATLERYNLITVDGNSLPVVVDSGSDWYEEVLVGRVDLYSDGKFETMFTWRRTSQSSGVTTDSETEGGTYVVSGSTFTTTYSTGSVISGTLSGSQINVTADGKVFLFQK